MEGLQGVAVADADQYGIGQALPDEGVEHGFCGFVQRRSGFVQQHDFGGAEQNADEGDALQFAG